MNKNYDEKIEKSYKIEYNKDTEISPKRDFFFKKIFGSEGNEDILIDLLEAILDIKISSLKLGQETIMPPEKYKERGGILDVRATLDDGTKINLEMQMNKFGDIGKRALFYLSKLYVKSIEEGTGYDDFPKTIVIFITNYTYYHNIEKYHTKWVLTEVDNVNEKIENVEIHIIELEKFNKKEYKEDDKLAQWLSYIDYDRKERVEMAIRKNPKIEKADKYIETLTKEQEEYLEELNEKGRLDAISIRYAAKKEGREEGRAEGRAEGMAEGRVQGEAKANKETAKRMLELGADIDFISKATGLSKGEIEKLM